MRSFKLYNALLYWEVGKRISNEILKGDRAQYGKQLIENLAKDLTDPFGRGWSKRNIQQMIRFFESFPNGQIVQTLSAQLSWSHFVQLISVNTPIKMEFYLSMSVQEHGSTRTLSERIDSQLYERTAISKKPEETIIKELKNLREKKPVNQDLVLKDPYILDFLGLNDSYLEKDLEDAILREMQQFLLEMGIGFTFIARQLTITSTGKPSFQTNIKNTLHHWVFSDPKRPDPGDAPQRYLFGYPS